MRDSICRQKPIREREIMALAVDPIEFNEWWHEARMQDDEAVHAFRALKAMEAIQFHLTVEESDEEKLEAVQKVAEGWK